MIMIQHVVTKVCNRLKELSGRMFQTRYPLLNPFLRIKQRREGAYGVVYMLHRVEHFDASKLYPTEDLKVSPEFLERLIRSYKSKGFDVLSLDQIDALLTSGQAPKRPFIAFTMDDGYLDNFTQAYPVFQRNDVPFTIYVATNFIDKEALLWWFSIEDLILSHQEIHLQDGSVYSCRTPQERWDTFRYLREKILRLNQEHLEEELNRVFASYVIDWKAPIREKSMSWEQVQELSRDPLCTIGGHTVSHPAFNKLTEEELCQEVLSGVHQLEQITGKKIHHFAYPYGSANEVGEREFEWMKKHFNFKTIFISYGGCITKHTQDRSKLPRVMLKEL